MGLREEDFAEVAPQDPQDSETPQAPIDPQDPQAPQDPQVPIDPNDPKDPQVLQDPPEQATEEVAVIAEREHARENAAAEIQHLKDVIQSRRDGIRSMQRLKHKVMWSLIDVQAELASFGNRTASQSWDTEGLRYRQTTYTHTESLIDRGAEEVEASVKFYDEWISDFRVQIACAKDKIQDLMLAHFGIDEEPEDHFDDHTPSIDMELFDWEN